MFYQNYVFSSVFKRGCAPLVDVINNFMGVINHIDLC